MSKARELAELGAVYDSGALSNRNLIINGAMNVAQRGTSTASVSQSGYHACDRWRFNREGSCVFTISQEDDAPAGLEHSNKFLVTTADTSLASTEHIRVEHKLEAQDVRRLAHGTSDAKKITVSFYVKSNKTGDYSVGLYKDGLSGQTISDAYTINTAGTWEYKTLTFSADTSSGFNSTDNDTGLRVWFTFGAGTDRTSGTANTWSTDADHRAVGQSVNLMDAVNNYWQITGVQLEVGSEATPFEHRSFGDELARCQRYYQKSYDSDSFAGDNDGQGAFAFIPTDTSDDINVNLPVFMRAAPTVTVYRKNGGATDQAQRADNAASYINLTVGELSERGFSITPATAVSGRHYRIHYLADAEL